MPAGLKWEINFGGTWTDVTSYVDMSSAVTCHFGRTSPSQSAQAATMQGLQLKNADYRFTPKSQLLSDGVTANPYYPNVVPGAAIRGSYTISATKYYFYYGLIQSWPPMVENGIRAYIPLQAVDRLSLLSGNIVQGAPTESMLVDAPLVLYPFTDGQYAVTYADATGGASATQIAIDVDAVFQTAADAGTPYADGLTGLTLTEPGTDTNFSAWQSPNIATSTAANTTWTVDAWMTFPPNSTGSYCAAGVMVQTPDLSTVVNIESFPVPNPSITVSYIDVGGGFQMALYSPPDNEPHLYTAVGVDNGTNLTVQFYVDGALFDTRTSPAGHGTLGSSQPVLQGYNFGFSGAEPGSIVFGPTAFYQTALTSTRVNQHYLGGVGGSGQTTGQRISEYLSWAGIAAGSEAISAGVQTVTAHSVNGKSLLTVCQDMALTEGGGSAFYQSPAGLLTFTDRHARFTNSSPQLTFDAWLDLMNEQYAPAFDNLTQVTRSALSRPTGPNQTYTYPAATVILSDADQTELYPDSDIALLNLAQERVSAQATPAFRVPQLPVEFVTAQTTGLYQAFGGISLASRLRLSNLVPGKTAPLASVDSYCEGWTVTTYQGSDRANFTVLFDTSPADNPVKGKWDTMPWASITGDSQLNALISAAATALAIKWSIGPQWTVTSGSYPLIMRVDEEDIQLNGVPSGSTSPQSWTGVTRGVNGTRAAPHAANAVITFISGNWQL